MGDRIQYRRDSAANWTTSNPTLYSGEPGYEIDTGRVKIGDGVHPWSVPGYEGPGSGGVIITAQGGTAYTLTLADINTEIEFTNPGGCVVSIPFFAEVPIPKGSIFGLVQMGAGTVTVGSGPIVYSPSSTSTNTQYSAIFLTCNGEDTYRLSGDLQ